MLHIGKIGDFVLLVVFVTTASTAAATGAAPLFGGAGAAVRTADTLLTALLGLVNIPRCKTNDRDKDHNNNNIYRFHKLISFRSGHTLP